MIAVSWPLHKAKPFGAKPRTRRPKTVSMDRLSFRTGTKLSHCGGVLVPLFI